jgi:hypothetical protein
MGSPLFFFETHWAHEPGRVLVVRALRSVAAESFDALVRVARWEDWFRLATIALLGDLVVRRESRWEDLSLPKSQPGAVAADA